MYHLLRYILITLLSITSFGCATNALHSSKNVSTEKINSFLITPDKATLVVAGEQHHFIFPLNEPLKSVLQWNGRAKLTPTFDKFTVNAGQSVSGSYTLQADVGKLTVEEHQFLTQRGFSQQGNTVAYRANIQGTRYLAGSVKVPQTAFFRQPYELTVAAPDGIADTAAKIALTPLTLTADGVTAVLGGIVLAPFFGLLMMSGGL
ncbi:hypothetical protein SAMN05660964_03747 [Thiothrix caldifontis]|uniref:Uncharacterized protein n=1 Tax=Thiothrix caldifontis TaxID=525918 RepID=A0A1H4GWA9_9GAMM|nr:hypothetical protein [Thiothrix caldifontis]SEB13561.1 hypothetical protein SAMN05660964_03747 [Thiothrix caldifontis]